MMLLYFYIIPPFETKPNKQNKKRKLSTIILVIFFLPGAPLRENVEGKVNGIYKSLM